MLCRHNLPQPLRKFQDPGDSTSGGSPCGLCAGDVFNAAFYRSLLAAAKGDAMSTSWRYTRIASDVYHSTLRGCPWCASIGNAILMSADWDYMIRSGNGLQGSVDGEDEETAGPSESAGSRGSENDEDSPGNSGPIAFEALDCSVVLDITIEFTKWDRSPVFNMVQVTIELSKGNGEDFLLLAVMDEEPVCIKFEAMSPDISPAVFPRDWDIVSTTSDEWVARAQSWLRACHEHKSCKSDGSFQPTRLIDVRNPENLRLVTRDHAVAPFPYATLSYVWGPAQSYILTKATCDQMHTKLESHKIAKTILDSTMIARRMGLEYLWVDALCIIQDSEEDKLKELPSMSDIYRESQLTIVAASASSATDGILREPSPPTFFAKPFQVEVKADGARLGTLVFGYRETYRVGVDPINSRAWTLQERVLSKRLLIFSNNGVMGMCRESHINPSGPADAGPPYQTSLNLDADDEEEVDDAIIRDQWMCARADYSEMDITYCSDKLPAISALAAEVSRRTRWTYLAGLWKENLFSELHWMSSKSTPSGETFFLKPQKVKDAGYIAPSWSWASTGVGMVVDGEDERDDREVFDFEILDCQVETAGESGFQFGPVTGGFLLVRGRVAELAFEFEDWQGPVTFELSLLDLRESECGRHHAVGEGTLDPLDDALQPDSTLFCLGMSRLWLADRQVAPVTGILLVPTGTVGTFRRVGYFVMRVTSVFDNSDPMVIRIE